MSAQLDPAIGAFLDQLKLQPGPKLRELAPAQAREVAKALYIMLDGAPVDSGAVKSTLIASGAGAIPARVYSPRMGDAEKLPGIVFFHGGGFVIGDLDCYDSFCRKLANGARCRVIALDYRLAPEHPFPAAHDDAVAAVRVISEQPERYGIDPAKLSVAGDSAGANLATAVSRECRGQLRHPLLLQILIYPVTQIEIDTASREAFSEGFFLERADLVWFNGHFLGRAREHARDPRASPLLAPDLAGLPSALVFTAGYDLLRDEGAHYAERMRQAGVPVTYVCFESLIHNFIVMESIAPAAREALEQIFLMTRNALNTA